MELITEDHLKHWLSEIQWQLNGINTELSKSGYLKCNGFVKHGSFLSLEYLREKQYKIQKLKEQIEWDTKFDV